MLKKINILLLLIAVTVWSIALSFKQKIEIIVCDVGQGDAILIQQESTQILIDGGPDNSVLNCLGRHMPFWDREIEMVVLTHPQIDHYGGLISVSKNYQIEKFAEYNQEPSSQSYLVLKNILGSNGVEMVKLYKGMEVVNGLMHFDVLNPERNQQSKNVNDDGIVLLLKTASFKAIFMADVEKSVSDEIAKNIDVDNVEYIKVNHHGSINGLTENLIKRLKPTTAVISVAKKNRYGHPDAEIIEMLKRNNVKIERTDEVGDVVITQKSLQ